MPAMGSYDAPWPAMITEKVMSSDGSFTTAAAAQVK
jgi:hypothetical protein